MLYSITPLRYSLNTHTKKLTERWMKDEEKKFFIHHSVVLLFKNFWFEMMKNVKKDEKLKTLKKIKNYSFDFKEK